MKVLIFIGLKVLEIGGAVGLIFLIIKFFEFCDNHPKHLYCMLFNKIIDKIANIFLIIFFSCMFLCALVVFFAKNWELAGHIMNSF